MNSAAVENALEMWRVSKDFFGRPGTGQKVRGGGLVIRLRANAISLTRVDLVIDERAKCGGE